jgi:hypothetical protein
MKNINLIFMGTILGLLSTLQAQVETPVKQKRLVPVSASIFLIFQTQVNSPFSTSDFTQYVTKFANPSNYREYSYDVKPGFAGLISFNMKSKTGQLNKNREFRLGINYQERTFFQGSVGDYNSQQQYDTLVSNKTGQKVTINQYYWQNSSGVTYKAKLLKADISVLFKTSEKHALRLFGGVGLGLGGTLSHTVTAFENVFNTSNSSGNSNYSYYQSPQTSNTNYNLKPKLYSSLYVPFGLDLTLSKRADFWNKITPSIEVRPSIEFFNQKKIYNLGANFGIKVAF